MQRPEPGLATKHLTKKQQAVFDFIHQFFAEHRKSPLIREIQLGCQITSYKSAIDRLSALEHKGFIKRFPNKHRGIRVIQRVVAAQRELTPVPLETVSLKDPV